MKISGLAVGEGVNGSVEGLNVDFMSGEAYRVEKDVLLDVLTLV